MTTSDIPDKANELHQQARELGASGEYTQAIELFAQAHALAPNWPYPMYDMAFTYLLMQDFDKARECYDETVKMSPRGFFTAITAFDTLNREADGDLPQGTYAAYIALEWMNNSNQKAKGVASLVDQLPQFAPAWKEYALLCEDPTKKLTAIEHGLAANPDAETKGILLLNKAFTFKEQGKTKAAIAILTELAHAPDTTFSNEHLAKHALAMLTR